MVEIERYSLTYVLVAHASVLTLHYGVVRYIYSHTSWTHMQWCQPCTMVGSKRCVHAIVRYIYSQASWTHTPWCQPCTMVGGKGYVHAVVRYIYSHVSWTHTP